MEPLWHNQGVKYCHVESLNSDDTDLRLSEGRNLKIISGQKELLKVYLITKNRQQESKQERKGEWNRKTEREEWKNTKIRNLDIGKGVYLKQKTKNRDLHSHWIRNPKFTEQM